MTEWKILYITFYKMVMSCFDEVVKNYKQKEKYSELWDFRSCEISELWEFRSCGTSELLDFGVGGTSVMGYNQN